MHEVTVYDDRYGPISTEFPSRAKAEQYARFMAPAPADVHPVEFVNETQK